MKIDPKYAFLLAFFLIWASCLFKNLSIWPKTYLFFPILHVFAPPNDVRAYIALSWKTTLITWIFLRGWYPTSDTSGPPGRKTTLIFYHIFFLTTMIINFKYKCPPDYKARNLQFSSQIKTYYSPNSFCFIWGNITPRPGSKDVNLKLMKWSSCLNVRSNNAVSYTVYCVSLNMVTITRHVFINIFQTEHFSSVKFAMGYEKNIMSFFFNSKVSKFWREKKLKR